MQLSYNLELQSWAFLPEKGRLCSDDNLFVNICSHSIHNSQRIVTTQISFSEWVVKLWYTHTTEYFSATKENKLLIRNNLDGATEIMLNEKRRFPHAGPANTISHMLVSPPAQPRPGRLSSRRPAKAWPRLHSERTELYQGPHRCRWWKRLFLFKSYSSVEIAKCSNNMHLICFAPLIHTMESLSLLLLHLIHSLAFVVLNCKSKETILVVRLTAVSSPVTVNSVPRAGLLSGQPANLEPSRKRSCQLWLSVVPAAGMSTVWSCY